MMFIPIVNYFILFVWVYNYKQTQTEYKIFAKSLILIFIATIPLEIINIILCKLIIQFKLLYYILNICIQYLVGLSLGFWLIKYQKKLY